MDSGLHLLNSGADNGALTAFWLVELLVIDLDSGALSGVVTAFVDL